MPAVRSDDFSTAHLGATPAAAAMKVRLPVQSSPRPVGLAILLLEVMPRLASTAGLPDRLSGATPAVAAMMTAVRQVNQLPYCIILVIGISYFSSFYYSFFKSTGTGTIYCNKYETVVSRRKRPCHSSVLAFVGRAVSCVTPQEDSMKKLNESSEDSVVIITHQ